MLFLDAELGSDVQGFLNSEEVLLKEKKKINKQKNLKHIKFVLCNFLKWNYKIL